MRVRCVSDLSSVDWRAMKRALVRDRFDNGRTPAELRRSFEASRSVVAYSGDEIVGTARVLTDGVCNAYLVDVWTRSDLRRRGIARKMVRRLCAGLRGQHVYLQAEGDAAKLWRSLGFREQPVGMSRIVGTWLRRRRARRR
jgi:predicted GNAT family acetyltransferase